MIMIDTRRDDTVVMGNAADSGHGLPGVGMCEVRAAQFRSNPLTPWSLSPAARQPGSPAAVPFRCPTRTSRAEYPGGHT
jgi:hypothetical protein